jgi:hypothetical protein
MPTYHDDARAPSTLSQDSHRNRSFYYHQSGSLEPSKLIEQQRISRVMILDLQNEDRDASFHY